jgi:hypothetical protein
MRCRKNNLHGLIIQQEQTQTKLIVDQESLKYNDLLTKEQEKLMQTMLSLRANLEQPRLAAVIGEASAPTH